MALDRESQEQCIEKARNSIWQCHEDPMNSSCLHLIEASHNNHIRYATDANIRRVINVCKKSTPKACYSAASSLESCSGPSMTHSSVA
ncbi:conserved hypothetical protein [Ricinus communis]|uniref:Uncharacterized protein n=1 Tax=Ricinus communis TaxID=3988 RepID=B9SAP0_RICCO|nr:conserved hypothetical protein [Ricinus communis]